LFNANVIIIYFPDTATVPKGVGTER